MAAPEGVPREHFPDAAILPGLVNAHTHLELTGLVCDADCADFPGWIRRLRELKAQRTRADFLAAARQGIADCRAAGVTTVADTGDTGTVIEALAEAGASGVAYVEVFGPHPDQAADALADLARRVAELRQFAGDRVRIGASPHAPYSVSGLLYRRVAEWARREALPLAVHIAESAAESALLTDGSGPFAEMWGRRGIPMPEPAGDTPVGWLHRHHALGDDTLCIHVVRADDTDIALLAASGSAVAHCPISNRAHAHGAAPLAGLLRAGVPVGCGTDSVLSVGRLDLLAEARAARSLGHLSAPDALSLCTLSAARAIGMDHEVGSLRAGKWGDTAMIALPSGSIDPEEAILASGPEDVLVTYQAGVDVSRRVSRFG